MSQSDSTAAGAVTKRYVWKLRDVILMAILGLLFAIIYLAVFQGGLALSALLTPLGLANYAFEIVYGIWFMAATLAAYILQKPGAALLTEVLAAAIELLMGNSGGLTVVLTGIIQGLGAELGFALFRYKKWNLASMSLASVLSALFIFTYELWYLSYYLLSPVVLAGQLAVRLLSAILFSAVLCKLAGDALARTGVLKSYALGARQKAVHIYAEDDDQEVK
ncbi:MAG: ECF transporter S component [Oscillospiraceae bacterium]|nr:ECF transporter S component [Oscillospiraceae bacterium]MDD4368070.1 ECF transporter S component [Oscillospiraceae bacterium]